MCSGRVATATGTDGRRAAYEYDGDGRLVVARTPTADVTYSYEGGLLISALMPDHVHRVGYAAGSVVSIETDGNRFTFANASERAVEIVDETAHKRSVFTYESDRLVAVVADGRPVLDRSFDSAVVW